MSTESIWSGNSLQSRKDRWEALWALEDLPRPLWFVPADPMLVLAAEYNKRGRSLRSLMTDNRVQLAESVRWNDLYLNLQRLFFRDDFIPRVQPLLGIGVFASAFGAEVSICDEQLPMTHPVIRENEPAEKVYRLQPPGVDAGQLGEILDYTDYFARKLDGKYPIAMTDLQGPLDSAYLVWNTNDFMVAMLEHPREVHHLMRMVTDLIIKFTRDMRQRAGWFVPAHFPPVYLPDGKGIAVSEDVLALLNPRLYEQFSLPYLNELSEEFGGVVVHSCGNIAHQLGVLEKIHNLRGINFGVSETDFKAVWDRFGGRTVIIPHCSSVSIVADFKTAYEWVEHVLRIKTTNRGLALMVEPSVTDIHKSEMKTALRQKSSLFDDVFKVLLFGARMRKLIRQYN